MRSRLNPGRFKRLCMRLRPEVDDAIRELRHILQAETKTDAVERAIIDLAQRKGVKIPKEIVAEILARTGG